MCSKLSFTTTALVRPEILEQTYLSFSNNIEGVDIAECVLYINIDPVPYSNKINKLRKCMLSIAKKYFNNVVYRLPEQPNFTDALNWCWTQADTPYIFHLEDDWVLLKKININEIFDLFDKKSALALTLKSYSHKQYGLALSPSVWKRSLYKVFAGKLDINRNPESQLKDKCFSYMFNQENIITLGNNNIVKDIGRAWLEKKGLEKPDKLKFVRY